MDTEAWQRLATKLVERRASLRPDWSERTIFARDTGLSYRSISDLETARRSNYKASWLVKVERAYQWGPGSIQRILGGGDATPAAEVVAGAPPAASADPQAAPSADWEGELVGPSGPVLEGEVLRWKRNPDRDTLVYELAHGDVSMSTGFFPHETPEDVIDELREQVEQIELRSKQRERRIRR